MSMTQEAFAVWLEKYGRAWEARDANAAADLYAEKGTYIELDDHAKCLRVREWWHKQQTTL